MLYYPIFDLFLTNLLLLICIFTLLETYWNDIKTLFVKIDSEFKSGKIPAFLCIVVLILIIGVGLGWW